jgi:hypothetical protein
MPMLNLPQKKWDTKEITYFKTGQKPIILLNLKNSESRLMLSLVNVISRLM